MSILFVLQSRNALHLLRSPWASQCLELIHLLSVIVTSRSTEWQFSDTGGWLVPEGAYRELIPSPSLPLGFETL